MNLTPRQDQVVAMLELFPRKEIARRLKLGDANIDTIVNDSKHRLNIPGATDAMLVAHMLIYVRPAN